MMDIHPISGLALRPTSHWLFDLLLGPATIALLYAFSKLISLLTSPYTSPIRNLRGPPSPSWFYGHTRVVGDDAATVHENWVHAYGSTLRYKGILNRDRLITVDTKALHHILTNSADYQKPERARFHLSRMLGEGVLFVEGEQHHKQRRIMNPAFGPAQIRAFTGIFFDKALELRDALNANIQKGGNSARIDALAWLNRCTLDIIGLAGFDYKFDAIAGTKSSELLSAFQKVMGASKPASGTSTRLVALLELVQTYFPLLRIFQTRRQRDAASAQRKMREIGMGILNEKKAAISAHSKGHVEKHSEEVQGRDLLTLLLRANMAEDLPAGQQLSDEDVIAQVPTFLVAGHETTASALTWCLFALTQAPSVQAQLREELLSIPTGTLDMDELNSLPYLDAVVHETMRMHTPVTETTRVAQKDDVIPLQNPITDANGQIHESITIKKGTPITIPILAINRSKDLWGADAHEFKPERWDAPPEAVAHIPGIWGHLMSFLGGPRACIGYRFSLIELKALLFTLVRTFEFELAVPAADIQRKTGVVQRPVVRGEPEKGSQLPLVLTLVDT